jgi:hypothetical protein
MKAALTPIGIVSMDSIQTGASVARNFPLQSLFQQFKGNVYTPDSAQDFNASINVTYFL